jgi:hypothetical protein
MWGSNLKMFGDRIISIKELTFIFNLYFTFISLDFNIRI